MLIPTLYSSVGKGFSTSRQAGRHSDNVALVMMVMTVTPPVVLRVDSSSSSNTQTLPAYY